MIMKNNKIKETGNKTLILIIKSIKTAFCTKYAQYSHESVNQYRAALGQHIKNQHNKGSDLCLKPAISS